MLAQLETFPVSQEKEVHQIRFGNVLEHPKGAPAHKSTTIFKIPILKNYTHHAPVN